MDQYKIGAFLRELRKENGITQEILAEKLNISDRTVSRWETGNNLPDINVLIKLSELYDISIPEIINGERKSEKMNEEVKEVAQSLSNYADAEKENILIRMRIQCIIGVVASCIYLIVNSFKEIETSRILHYISTISLTQVIIIPIVMLMYITGLMKKINKNSKLQKVILYFIIATILIGGIYLLIMSL